MQRISTQNMSYQYLGDLNRALVKQNKMQEQLSSGRTLNRASDDPIRITRSLRLHSSLAQNDKYTSNSYDALSFMQSTDDALQTMSSALIRAKEIVVGAANTGTLTADELKAYGQEVDQLVNTLLDAANTRVGDRYLFGGQMDHNQPFERNPDGTVSFFGDNNYISMRLQAGGVNPDQDAINVTCSEAFGTDLQMFNELNEIAKKLKDGDVSGIWLSNVALANIDKNHSRVLNADAALGARMNSFNMMNNMLLGRDTIIQADISMNEDTDYPKAISDYKLWENIYNASLKVGAKVLPMSLADFV